MSRAFLFGRITKETLKCTEYDSQESIDSNKQFLSLLCVQDKITAMSENRKNGFHGVVPIHLRDPHNQEIRSACLILSKSFFKPLIPMFFFPFSFVSFVPSTIFE